MSSGRLLDWILQGTMGAGRNQRRRNHRVFPDLGGSTRVMQAKAWVSERASTQTAVIGLRPVEADTRVGRGT